MWTELIAADGHRPGCWMEPAEGHANGGLVILQEIFGVTDQLKSVATRYARAGYDTAIPALFDRREKGAVIPYEEAARGRDMAMGTLPDEALMDIAAAVATLGERGGPVAVMGFCWGGGLALRAAQKLRISGAVVFYGTRLQQYLDHPLKAPVQAHFGREDDHTPEKVVAELQDHLPEVEVHWYDAGHAFANDARPDSFNGAAAEAAHGRALEFLHRQMG
jgi:carboxymethylenebutenolidase